MNIPMMLVNNVYVTLAASDTQISYQKSYSCFGLLRLPFGLPRFFTWDIQAGGLPRRFPRPAAIRSNTRIACSIPSRVQREVRTAFSKCPLVHDRTAK
jgi:hypothetical protein